MRLGVVTLCVLMIVSLRSYAIDNVMFDGFATLSGVYSDADVPSWDGQSANAFDFSSDTRLGLQLTWMATQSLSATGQVIMRSREDFEPELDWAYLYYQWTDTIAVRLGRQQIPVFMVSDYENVGYAYVWPRPPYETYWQVPGTNFDGINAIYRESYGNWDLTGQLSGGRSEIETLNAIMEAWGLNLDITDRQWRFGAIYFNVDIDSSFMDSLGSQMRQTAVQVAAVNPGLGTLSEQSLKDWLVTDGDKATFKAVSMGYDNGKFLFNGEFTRREVAGIWPETEGWHVTLGYHFKQITPYITLAKTRCANFDNNYLVGQTPMEQAIVTIYNPVIKHLLEVQQQSKAVGIRYDFNESAALKVEYKRVNAFSTIGTYTDTPSDDGKVQVFTVLVDYVF